MCTLALGIGLWPDFPLVVAANRDERLDRPSSPPSVWPGPPRFVAPRDDKAGGTWLGVNERRLFVGITNRAGDPPDPRRLSRGALVTDALMAPSARELRARLERLSPTIYNPFHLAYADGEAAFVTWADSGAVHHLPLPTGLHVVTERSFGGDDQGREEMLRREWPSQSDPEALHRLLGRHGDNPIGSLCIHAPEVNYGTRSSTVLLMGPQGSRLEWTEGHPCTSAQREVVLPFEDVPGRS